MSAPFGPFVLTLDDITKQIRGTFETFIDPRKGKNRSYTMVDAGLSALSVFFMQSPSFYLCVETWEALMDFMLQSFEPAPPKPKTG